MAGYLNLPVTAGSDSHHWLQVGCVRNHLWDECQTANEIRDCIKAGRFETVISPGIDLQLTSARFVKTMLKKIKNV